MRSLEFDIALVAALPILRKQAVKLAKSFELADDLVQTVAAKALAAHQQFTPGTQLGAWLWTILRNEFVQRRRSSKNRIVQLTPAIAWSPDGRCCQPGDRMELIEALELIDTIDLPRCAVFFDVVLGMEYRDCAAANGCAEGTVKSSVSRWRAELRKRRDECLG